MDFKIKHPAVYTNSFIPVFAELLEGKDNVLDVFGGTGKLALIKDFGFSGRVICNEIEKEWANSSVHQVDEWRIGDAAKMDWAKSETIDAICTSPTYGNRMADHFESKDGSSRITYRHTLGRCLSEHNTGRMQWGEKYRQKHLEVYKECFRVLKPSGSMIVNISNHIRNGEEIDVVAWHKEALRLSGFELIEERKIKTPRMGFGRNGNLRVECEVILVYIKPAYAL